MASSPDSVDEMVVVTRTVTVEVRVPRSSYMCAEDGRLTGAGSAAHQMTEVEIRDYESSLEPADAFQMLTEMMSVADPDSIKQSCTVEFTLGIEKDGDV